MMGVPPSIAPGANRLSTQDFIAELFCRIDDRMFDVPKDPRAHLWPGKIVTLGVLLRLKGGSQRRFYQWLSSNYRPLFPHLPERTRLFRLLAAHQAWADRFLAEPTLINYSDSLGIELLHPRRHGRSAQQIGKKGLSNGRWIMGVKFCPLLNGRGQIVDWDADPANVHDGHFQRTIGDYETREHDKVACLTDKGFHRSARRGGDCTNLVICERGQRNYRMIIETVFSGWVRVLGMKKIGERLWPPVEARLAFACAAWNLVTAWATQSQGGTWASLSTAWVPI